MDGTFEELLNDNDHDLFRDLELTFSYCKASDNSTKHEIKALKQEQKEEGELKEGQEDGNRFRRVGEEDIKVFKESHQSKRTGENTKWAVKVFQDWHRSRYAEPLNTSTVSEELLGPILFYCEVTPQPSERRSTAFGAGSKVYRKNSMKNIRSGLNRYLTDLGRDMDIVHGKSFKAANRTLDGFMKEQTKAGLSRPTHHKPIIEQSDLETISRFFANAPCSPIILRQCVWFQLALHFVSRGLEFHHQLQIDSFEFTEDHDGIEYVTLKHETQQKKSRVGLPRMRLHQTAEFIRQVVHVVL
ncbi:uncharacterized protein LOC128230908 [Mya arenaria]|uniref:uncharacterized protein LOC128230908 n=1 Tax=Mya arenaria TaxID=6604 RepID=UPI0022E7173A|nr:uncharacterized protein LOC128230908 [Mya arenaria]